MRFVCSSVPTGGFAHIITGQPSGTGSVLGRLKRDGDGCFDVVKEKRDEEKEIYENGLRYLSHADRNLRLLRSDLSLPLPIVRHRAPVRHYSVVRLSGVSSERLGIVLHKLLLHKMYWPFEFGQRVGVVSLLCAFP